MNINGECNYYTFKYELYGTILLFALVQITPMSFCLYQNIAYIWYINIKTSINTLLNIFILISPKYVNNNDIIY